MRVRWAKTGLIHMSGQRDDLVELLNKIIKGSKSDFSQIFIILMEISS